MPGLAPGIHVFLTGYLDRDGRQSQAMTLEDIHD